MIFITSDMAIGSKAFMHELADAIRPKLEAEWHADELEDFDLSLLQEMIHFGDLSSDDFNTAVDAVAQANINEVDKNELLDAMKADPRYKTSSPA